MPTGQPYPPHKLPGLDTFAKDAHDYPALTDIGVTKAHAHGTGDLNIHATWTDNEAPDGILLRIWKKRGPTHWDDAWHISIGDLDSRFEDHKLSTRKLNLQDHETNPTARGRFAALAKLSGYHDEIHEILQRYLATVNPYVINRADTIAKQRSKKPSWVKKLEENEGIWP
jgi:hypothetical protein